MSITPDDILEWQASLSGEFAELSRLSLLEHVEQDHSTNIRSKGYGFGLLMRSYQEFVLQSLDEASKHGHVLNIYNVGLNMAAFRRFRTCLIAYSAGYYLDACSALRTILEVTMYLAAVLKGAFWFNRIHEITQLDPASIPFRKMKKLVAEHSRVLSAEIKKHVYGDLSGLTHVESESIERLIQSMHMHVHRAESSLVGDVLHMVRNHTMPRVEPTLDLKRASIFCNPAVLVAWTHVRVLPYLSIPARFSPVWRSRYSTLDGAFRYYIAAWEKPTKDAFLRLLDTGFTFNEQTASQQVGRTTKLDAQTERAADVGG